MSEQTARPVAPPSAAESSSAASGERTALLSVIIPVYNEDRLLADVLHRLFDAHSPVAREVIVVDDGSTDGSLAVARSLEEELGLRVIARPQRAGKGAALQEGIALARGDFICVQDADLEYDPRDLPQLLAPLLED